MVRSTIFGKPKENEQTALEFIPVPDTICDGQYSRGTFFFTRDAAILPSDCLSITGNIPVTPQGLLSSAATSLMLSRLRNGDLNAALMARLEVAIAAYASLSECTTVKAFVGTLYLVLRTEYKGAITHGVFSAILEYLDLGESKEVDMQGEDELTPDWLTCLRTAGENWQLALTNPCMKRVHKLITMMVTMGVCGPVNMKFGNLSLFSVAAEREQVSAVNLADACFKTVTFLAESGYAAYSTSSFMPFLFTHENAVRLDHEYLELLDLCDYALPGNLERLTNTTPHEYLYRMQKCIDETSKMMDSLQSSIEKRLVMSRLQTLRSKLSEYMQLRVSGGLRVAPYAMYISGGSGLGKSDVTDILYKACGAFNDIDVGPDKVCTFNSDEKFMSSWKSYMTVLKFDDFSNTKSDFTAMAPTAMLIKTINNVREAAIKAELADKGKCALEPMFVTVNGNMIDMDVNAYSNCPASALRRGNIHLTCVVKPQFRKDDSQVLDPQKANEFYTVDGVVQQPPIPDLWDMTLYKSLVVSRQTPLLNGNGQANHEPEQVKFVPIVWRGKEMVNVPFAEVVDYCLEDSARHFAQQRALIERTEANAIMPVCSRCKKPHQLCACVPIEEPATETVVEDDEVLDSHAGSDFLRYVTTKSYKAWNAEQQQEQIRSSWSTLLDGPAAFLGKTISSFLHRNNENALKYGAYQLYALHHRHSDSLLSLVNQFENSFFTKWTNYLPSSWLKNKFLWNFVLETRVNTLAAELDAEFYGKWTRLRNWIFPVLWAGAWFGLTRDVVVPIASLTTTMVYSSVVHILQKFYVYDIAKERLMKEHADVPKLFKRIREKNGKYICGTIAAFAAAYAAYKVWQNVSFTTGQGMLSPETVEDLEARDKEVNIWKNVECSPRPVPEKRVADMSQLEETVSKATVFIRTNSYVSDAFLVSSNRMIVPNHVLQKSFERGGSDTITIEVIRRGADLVNHKFATIVSRDYVVRIGEHDLVLVDVPNSGSVKNNIGLFPDRLLETKTPMSMFYRSKEGEIVKYDAVATPKKSINNGLYDFGDAKSLRKFDGLDYNLSTTQDGVKAPAPTFDGMCASVVCIKAPTPYIGAFHLGGRTGTNYGVGATVLRSEIDAAMLTMANDGISTQCADASDVHESYGIQHITGNSIHAKSPLRFLGAGNLEIFGSCAGRSTPTSRVRASILSDDVTRIMGVPNTWGAPKFKGPDGQSAYHPWRESLQYSANPSAGVPPALLKRAKDDYVAQMKEAISDKYEYFKGEIKPLTNVQIVSGIDGKRFIDSMNLSTSRGFPLGGPKSQDVIELDPTADHACPRTLEDIHWKELEHFEEVAKTNTRVNVPFKACLKDEPTPIDKDKVRVFQAASMPLQMAMRKYFLPVARMMSQFPLLSECAVGINAHGPEMDQLFRHIKKMGKSRGYAGDYSKYDLRMPAQLVFTAFDVMISFAEMFPENYSPEDITIMKVIASEVACAVTAFNGDYIQFIGSNPSGQSLTAYINSIVNSLLHRCSFFAWGNGRMIKCRFKDFVALITYGDDYGGTVSKAIGYNNCDFVDWCKKYDMVVTPPDKKSAVVPYLDCDELDFLKRRPKFNPDLNLEMGILDEKSIFKSLHSNLRTDKATDEDVAASCINSALSEWFLYGKTVYDSRREQLKSVATAAGVEELAEGLALSYEERIDNFRSKYNWV